MPTLNKPTLNQEEERTAYKEPIKNIALGGGGAKGAAYPGALKALDKAGVLKNIENIAGSSAGAITASFIAMGMDGNEYAEIMSKTNLKDLSGKKTGIIESEAAPLLDMARTNILNQFQKWAEDPNSLSRIDKTIKEQTVKLQNESSPEGKKAFNASIDSLEKIKLAVERVDNNSPHVVTFADLHAMHLVEPEKFKNLSVTVTNQKTGELEILNYENSPNVEIALACRASASLPAKFKPVEINGKTYVDGGYRDNVPQAYFPKNEQNKQDRTLVIAFGSMKQSKNTFKALYTNKEKIYKPTVSDRIIIDHTAKTLAKIGGDITYTDTEKQTFKEIRENALNHISLDTKDVGTLDFDKAQEKAKYLTIIGEISTRRHLDNFDLSNQPDPNLDLKEFALELYEKITDPKNKLSKSHQTQADQLLELIEQDQASDAMATKIISISQKTGDTSKTFSHDTKMMHILTEMLNERSTSSVVQRSFAMASDNIAEHKAPHFSPEDFKNFEQKNNRADLEKQQFVLAEKYVDLVKTIPKHSLIQNLPEDIKTSLIKTTQENIVNPWESRDKEQPIEKILEQLIDGSNKFETSLKQIQQTLEENNKQFTNKTIFKNTLIEIGKVASNATKSLNEMLHLDTKSALNSLQKAQRNFNAIGKRISAKEQNIESIKNVKELHNRLKRNQSTYLATLQKAQKIGADLKNATPSNRNTRNTTHRKPKSRSR